MTTKEFDGGLQSNQQVSIGIDQSLTGFAFSAVSVEFPTQHKTWVYKSPYNGIQRLDDIQSFLYNRFNELKDSGNTIVDIAMETPFLGSPSTLSLSELAAAVKLFLYDHFYDTNNYQPALDQVLRTPLQVPPMTLKKYATGKGTSKKQEMLLQIYKRWGVEFNDDNAADAYALARLSGGHSIDAVEAKVIDQIKDVKYRDSIAE
jgi:Holliday junction resolvasome RuvABC endonuclease subunit